MVACTGSRVNAKNAQLTVMNSEEWQDWEKHLIWWVDGEMFRKQYHNFTTWHQFMDFRTLVGCAGNVYPHVVFNYSMFVDKLKDIFTGKYKPLQRHAKPKTRI